MASVCEFGDPKDDIGFLIWKILKAWQRDKHRALDEYGMTASQLEIMGAVYHKSTQQVEITQILLSQDTNIDPMTVSTILRNLQKKGLIHRTESKIDTRARVVEMTDDGRDLFVRALTKVKEKQEHLFRNINKDALREQLQLLLAEMIKN